MAAAAAVLAGCGGDDDKSASKEKEKEDEPTSTTERVYRQPTTGQTTPEEVQPPATAPETAPETPPGETPPEPRPDDEGGDEEPARFEVVLNATRRGVRPRQVNVAPYISVKVTLVSKDGSSHTLAIAGKKLRVGGTRKRAFAVLPGLRPQRFVTGVFDNSTKVVISGSAEPGP